MDVGVGESGEDAATLEVDAVGAREGGLVRADAADHDLARDREGTRLGQRGVERTDDSVLEDHAAIQSDPDGLRARRPHGGGDAQPAISGKTPPASPPGENSAVTLETASTLPSRRGALSKRETGPRP